MAGHAIQLTKQQLAAVNPGNSAMVGDNKWLRPAEGGRPE
jgi:hypothetical protein